jgi:hypothetical protein
VKVAGDKGHPFIRKKALNFGVRAIKKYDAVLDTI